MRLAAFLLAAGLCLAADASYDYLILATQRTSTLEKEMNEAASQGHCFATAMGGDTAAGKQAVVAMLKNCHPGSRRYKLLATQKTSTMQKELSEAGAEGFHYLGQTVYDSSFGGHQVVVILEAIGDGPRAEYKLLATTKTSTMEKELSEAGAGGFRLVGLSVGKTAFGGDEIVAILERLIGD